jgi:hypothetical protein
MSLRHSLTAAGICGLLVLVMLWTITRVQRIHKHHCTFDWTSSPFNYPFKAGDVLLTTGNSVSRFMVQTLWGHVALVYRDPRTNMLYVWENGFPVQGTWWTFTNSLKSKSTKLTPLLRYLYRCNHTLCVRPISKEVDAVRFAEYVQKKWNQPFDYNYFASGANRIFMDLVNVPVLRRTKTSHRFCAELIAETLVHLGVLDFHASLDPSVKPDTVIPRDFTQINEHLPWVAGWSLGPQTLLFR